MISSITRIFISQLKTGILTVVYSVGFHSIPKFYKVEENMYWIPLKLEGNDRSQIQPIHTNTGVIGTQ